MVICRNMIIINGSWITFVCTGYLWGMIWTKILDHFVILMEKHEEVLGYILPTWMCAKVQSNGLSHWSFANYPPPWLDKVIRLRTPQSCFIHMASKLAAGRDRVTIVYISLLFYNVFHIESILKRYITYVFICIFKSCKSLYVQSQ